MRATSVRARANIPACVRARGDWGDWSDWRGNWADLSDGGVVRHVPVALLGRCEIAKVLR